MAFPPIYAFVIANKTSAFNGLFKDHPVLDPRGGGDETFSTLMQEEGDPAGAIQYAACAWSMSEAWFQEFLDLLPSGWKINDPDHPPGTDVAWYRATEPELWTWESAMADLTRKNIRLEVFEEEQLPEGVTARKEPCSRSGDE